MNTSWHSYPKIFALGHKAIADLFKDEVLVEEKIDGSQFSFGRFEGELKVRSKGAQINAEYPEKMFGAAVETVRGLDLKDGWTYRAEYLQKPKHNSLAYDRVPTKNLIIFDINTWEEEYLSYEEKTIEADRLGLEIVPLIHRGPVLEPATLLEFLEHPSILGGQKIEGMVIKNYKRFGEDKKVLMGKYVSEAFKEVHGKEWRKENPTSRDIIQRLILRYRTPARWGKAVQHLREQGKIEDSPRDIGLLIKEAQADLLSECETEMKEILFEYARQGVLRGSVAGIAEWYKEELMKGQFESPENITT